MNIISYIFLLDYLVILSIHSYTLIYLHYCYVIIISIIILTVLTYTKLFITNKVYLYRQLSV